MIYSHSSWDTLLEKSINEIKMLSTFKGGEYAGDSDRLANFRRNAAALGLTMEQVWAVYAAKHWDAVMQYIKDVSEGRKRKRLESISGRLDDLIVYALLFKAMVEEREELARPIENYSGAIDPNYCSPQTEAERTIGKRF